jgi:hypothetical protein
MQKQFSTSGLLTLLVVILAGALVAARLNHIVNADDLRIPSIILWAGEIFLYLTVLFVWAPNIAPAFAGLGLGGMLVLRLLIGVMAGTVTVLVDARSANSGFSTCLSSTMPRLCSMVFAVLAFYPLRIFLGRRTSAGKDNRTAKTRTPKSSARNDQDIPVTPAVSAAKSANVVYGTPGAPAAAPNQTAQKKSGVMDFMAAPQSAAKAAPMVLPSHLEGYMLHIPMQVIASQLPDGSLRAEIADHIAKDNPDFELPLEMIAPQLKEALVQLSIPALLDLLPNTWVDAVDIETEDKITLPLEVVIPQVPEEVFALPAPNPPTWANLPKEEERILFAQV